MDTFLKRVFTIDLPDLIKLPFVEEAAAIDDVDPETGEEEPSAGEGGAQPKVEAQKGDAGGEVGGEAGDDR